MRKLFTSRLNVQGGKEKKNVLSFPHSLGERCRRERGEGTKQGWLEKGCERRAGEPRLGQAWVSGSGGDCREASTHEMHLDSVP